MTFHKHMTENVAKNGTADVIKVITNIMLYIRYREGWRGQIHAQAIFPEDQDWDAERALL